jgi:cytochrome P450
MANTVPGPKGEPVFGSSRRYARDPFAFIEAVESTYGDVAAFDMGPMDTYMVADPAAIERVLVSESDRFRKPDFQNDALGDLLGEGLLLSEGDTWERQRDLATPAFGMGRPTATPTTLKRWSPAGRPATGSTPSPRWRGSRSTSSST